MNLKRIALIACSAVGLSFLFSGHASAALTVTPLTWNVIGLDSNNPTSGPKYFPVGARVCSSVSTTTVSVNFVWDTANANINLRSGTLNTLSIPSLTAGGCSEAYFEAEVTQVAGAYDTARRFHITATDSSGTASTPTPRELYVEHLISQNRNSITGFKLDGTSIPVGGSMNMMVGNTYTIELDGGTATQGYEQFEAFINFPNTIFQILSVSTTYSADSNTTNVPNPNSKLYADACIWENDPTSPNYRACLGATDKAGGNVVTTYTIKILGGSTSQALNTLLYDFSGSSFHYNSDFSTGARVANIVDPATALNLNKAFSPSTTVAGGTSTLTFTIANTASSAVSGASFTDPLPSPLVVASPASYSTSGCGSPTFTPVAGSSSISFANGTVAANSSCVVTVVVSVPSGSTGGPYVNTTNHLFVGGVDSGKSATANLALTTATAGTGVCGLTLAQWAFTGSSLAATTQASNVSSAALSAGNSLTAVADAASGGGNPLPGVRTYGWLKATPIDTATSPYLQFSIDTSQSSNVTMQFDAQRKSNGPSTEELYYSTDGTTWTLKSTFASTTSWATYGAYDFTGSTNTSGTTYFRIYGNGANATSTGNDLSLDNVTFTGCGTPSHPTLTKSFSPSTVAVNGTSTLTFTLANPNSTSLTGVAFNDTLPAGLTVATSSTTQCGGTLSTTTPSTISFSGGTLPAAGCTVTVPVTAFHYTQLDRHKVGA